jgi:hypothetical protein
MPRLATKAGGPGSRPRLLTRAYHEAGHAIWGRQIGLPSLGISIRISGGESPVTLCDLSGDYEDAQKYSVGIPEDFSRQEAEQFLQNGDNRRLVKNLMMFDWAGPAAHMKLRRKVLPIHLQDDEKHLHQRAVYLGRGNQAKAERLARVMKARAVNFINDPGIWRLVRELAEYLVERLGVRGGDVVVRGGDVDWFLDLQGPASPG